MTEPMDTIRDDNLSSSYDMGMGDSDVEHSSANTEEFPNIAVDYWFGKKYFECVIAQCLLVEVGLYDGTLTIDSKMQDKLRRYPYEEGMKALQAQGLVREGWDDDSASSSYQSTMVCVGRTIRHGTRAQRTTLLTAIRQHCGLSASGFTTAPSTVIERIEPEENDPIPPSQSGKYASKLNEFGSTHDWTPKYDVQCLSENPPKWRAIISWNDFKFEGEGRNKPQARHDAARVACRVLKISVT